MKRAAMLMPGLAMLLFLVACATPESKKQAVLIPDSGRTQVVLIPDPVGKVGEIIIKNKTGSQTITKAGHMSEVRDEATATTPQAPMADKDIDRIFGAALAALPEQPVTFILYFKPESTDLTEASRKVLSSVRTAIDSRKSQDIRVIGHADRMGTKAYNYDLSRRRALRIRRILADKSLKPASIEIGYHGEANPLIKTPDGVPEPRNRRVEVTIR